jgi:hypothetical protein
MTPLLTAAVLLAATLAGYLLGRLRPLVRLDDWMWDTEPTRYAARWWLREAYAGVMIATHPWLIPRGLREQREKTQRVAKVEYDPEWATREPE